jgi:hypothetical protein
MKRFFLVPHSFLHSICPANPMTNSSASTYLSLSCSIPDIIASYRILYGLVRSIAHLIVGVLDGVNYSEGHLISEGSLDKTNHFTITRFVNDGLAKFFLPEKIPSEKILSVVTDNASYILKSAESLAQLVI